MFRRWRVNVKSLLKTGENVMRIYLHSPIKVDLPKWAKHPHLYEAANDQSENGGLLDRKLSVFARKAGYHYGWDWGPRLVASGIWRDVYLGSWSKARITDIHLRQREVSAKMALLTIKKGLNTVPAEGEWIESVRQEAVDNVRRLRNHPCVVVWCGGNECMDAWYNWGWKGRMEKNNPNGTRLLGQRQEHLYGSPRFRPFGMFGHHPR